MATRSNDQQPRDARIAAEAAALWRELYGEAPPAVDGGSMLDMICARLPEADYNRLRTPHLRPSNIAFPRDR